MNVWVGIKRPLFMAFFLGCTVSSLTARTLTLRLIVPGMVWWAFVPLIEIAALVTVCWRDRQSTSIAELIDSFFAGYRPWLFWLVGLCAIWAFLSPSTKPLDGGLAIAWIDGGAVLAVLWSLYIDFEFFRSVLRRSRAAAVRQLALQRLISWAMILGIVGGPTIWSEITGRLW
jgi:hypothetical protein